MTASFPGVLVSYLGFRRPTPACSYEKNTHCESTPTRVLCEGVHLGPKFDARVRSLFAGGPEKLQVITDFDQTLTCYIGADGHRGDECHGLLLARLDPDSVVGLKESPWTHLKELERLYIVGDHTGLESYVKRLDLDKDVTAWWFETYQQVSTDFKLWEHVAPCIACSNVRTRKGLDGTFTWLQDNAVPLLVVSAGLHQVLQGILSAKGCPLPVGASVVANDLQKATLTIDHLTKSRAFELAPKSHIDATRNRNCVLLLGDKTTDLAAAEGLSSDCVVLSICFLAAGLKEGREPSAAEIQESLQHFDVVLTGDASMHFVNGLLRSIAAADAGDL